MKRQHIVMRVPPKNPALHRVLKVIAALEKTMPYGYIPKGVLLFRAGVPSDYLNGLTRSSEIALQAWDAANRRLEQAHQQGGKAA